MKLVSLNLWGGQVFEPLMEFIEAKAQDTDIFCFQEVIFGHEAGFTEVHKARINLYKVEYFQSEILPEGVRAGQAIFVKNSLAVVQQGNFRTYDKLPSGTDYGGLITGSCQWAEVQVGKENLLIMSLHGLWQRDSDKRDTPERLEQSRILNEFVGKREGKKILCGDFNLIPDGQSMKSLEENMVNLVKEHGVTSTRSELYTKGETKFADYVLVSPEVKVKSFEVLEDVVSDHLPLVVKFA